METRDGSDLQCSYQLPYFLITGGQISRMLTEGFKLHNPHSLFLHGGR